MIGKNWIDDRIGKFSIVLEHSYTWKEFDCIMLKRIKLEDSFWNLQYLIEFDWIGLEQIGLECIGLEWGDFERI